MNSVDIRQEIKRISAENENDERLDDLYAELEEAEENEDAEMYGSDYAGMLHRLIKSNR